MGRISENFTMEEFERTSHSDFQEKNRVNDPIIRASIIDLVLALLQPLRTAWGKPLAINSGYRCPELNRIVGGAENSQHVRGEACDVAASDPLALATLAARLSLPFDQMILYGTFVHFSHKKAGRQRFQILYDKSYSEERVRLD